MGATEDDGPCRSARPGGSVLRFETGSKDVFPVGAEVALEIVV